MVKKISVIFFICVVSIMVIGCNNNNDEEVVSLQPLQENIDNNEKNDSLEIEKDENIERIKGKIKIINVQKTVINNITTVKGFVKNNTDKKMTIYMNVYLYDKEDKIKMTANAFCQDVGKGEQKEFTAGIVGDFSEGKVVIEVAKVEF